MKFLMDERVKHRLMGLIVILSIAAIFIPAIMKKSNQRFEESISISVRLPAKPKPPVVAVPERKALFQSVKATQVEVPPLAAEPERPQMAKAEPILQKPVVAKPKESVLAKSMLAKMELAHAPKPALNAKKPTKPLSSSPKEVYAVQLASFTQQSNAESLVIRLRQKGYKASYTKFSGKQGEYYKVVVGELAQRGEAVHLQKKLADNMQLNGFIVRTGVS